jgi:hypothetical protein
MAPWYLPNNINIRLIYLWFGYCRVLILLGRSKVSTFPLVLSFMNRQCMYECIQEDLKQVSDTWINSPMDLEQFVPVPNFKKTSITLRVLMTVISMLA